MSDIDESIKEEWRSLGFHYDIDDNAKNARWVFYGNHKGLSNFAQILDEYISEESLNAISEHRHYGPYSYLKIMTWHEREITNNFIGGTFDDLRILKNISISKLNSAVAGQSFIISSEYLTDKNGALVFFVMNDDFDPVSMDDNYN